MAARAEEGLFLRAGYSSREEGFFRPELRGRTYEKGTYLEALNPRFPRIPASRIPDSVDASFLTGDMISIYAASSDSRIGSTDGVIFPGGSASLAAAMTIPREREAGMNIYFNPYDGVFAPAAIVQGDKEEIPEVVDNLYELADKGYYMPLSLHSHPTNLLGFPTLDDWMPALQQRRMGENVPLLNGIVILGEVPVLAQMTEDSPLLTDRQCAQFWSYWERAFIQAQRHVEADWWGVYGTPAGIQSSDSLITLEQQKQAAEDSVRITLAESVKAKMFVLNDREEFEHKQPFEIISSVRERQQTIFPQAA